VTVTVEDFERSVAGGALPPGLSPALIALWHDARGDWQRAHAIAQDIEDATGAWIHAYLHRKEGDQSNAEYWYRRARRTPAAGDLAAEWTQIAGALLSSEP
jgi:hypothetical protein